MRPLPHLLFNFSTGKKKYIFLLGIDEGLLQKVQWFFQLWNVFWTSPSLQYQPMFFSGIF
jgi:hypothetical protein